MYKDDIKPILDFTSGDIKGYRGVGEVKYRENADGLIISISSLWDNDGVEHKVKGVGIQYSGTELTPTFQDEINRHLLGKIGYSVLAGLTGAYGDTSEQNNEKDTTTATVPTALMGSAGKTLSGTFANLASQYKTEVKVYPQTLLVIFY